MTGPISIPGLVVEEPVGRGGFAVVYRARQLAMGRDVAVKVDHRVLLTERDRRRFVREAMAVGRLSGHPHVVTVHDTGTLADWRAYLVMEYCPLGSLQDLLDASGPLPPDRVAQIGTDIADALATAHAAGILHRDLKPANLLRRDETCVVLSDFGIASLLGDESHVSATQEAFTAAFAAPELLGDGVRTHAGDVYALAATLHTLLVGRPPYAPGSGNATAAKYLAARSVPLTSIPGAPPALSTLLCRALHPDPDQRPTAAELRDQLALLAAERGQGRPAGAVVQAPRAANRRTTRMAGAIVATAAASALVVGYLVQRPAVPTVAATRGPATQGPASPGSVTPDPTGPATTGPAAATGPTAATGSGAATGPGAATATATTAARGSTAAATVPARTGPATTGRAPTSPGSGSPAPVSGAGSGFVSNGAAVAAAVTQVSNLIASSSAAVGDPRAGSQLLQIFLSPPQPGGAGQVLTIEFCGKAPTAGSGPGPTYAYAVDAPGAAPRRISRDSGFPYCMDPGSVNYTLLRTLVDDARRTSGLSTRSAVSWMVTTNHWVPAPMWIVKVDDGVRVATLTAALSGTGVTVTLVPKAQAEGLPTAP